MNAPATEPAARRPLSRIALWMWGLGTFLLVQFIALWQTRLYASLYSQSIYTLSFEFGPVIRNLAEGQGYGVTYTDHPLYGSLTFAAHRLPLIPCLLALLSRISAQTWAVLALKNALFYALSWYGFWRLWRRCPGAGVLLLLSAGFFYLAPVNRAVASALSFEEGYLYHLLPATLALLLAGRSWERALSGSLGIGALYLTKSSLLLPCLVLTVYFALRQRPQEGSWVQVAVGIAVILSAVVGWGLFSYARTGIFAFGARASSFNGWNLYKGNNPYFADYYPARTLDLLDSRIRQNPPLPFRDEWDFHAYYQAQALDYMRAHPWETLHNGWRKFAAAFLLLSPVPSDSRGDLNAKGRWLYGAMMLVNHLLLWAGLLYSLGCLLRRSDCCAAGFLFFALVVAWTLPYLIGFAYHRHMMPLYGAAIVWLVYVTASRFQEPPGKKDR